MKKGIGARAISGPTKDDNTPFSWAAFANSPIANNYHQGQPDTFNFDWVTFIVQ